jgi:hypothetical protein
MSRWLDALKKKCQTSPQLFLAYHLRDVGRIERSSYTAPHNQKIQSTLCMQWEAEATIMANNFSVVHYSQEHAKSCHQVKV